MRLVGNFNAGPAVMPESVLQRLHDELMDYQGTGLSVLEMSHRSPQFIDIAQQAEASLRELLDIPDRYSVIFMQGGASAQFALTVQNLDVQGQVAFVNTGYWSKKAMQVAHPMTQVHCAAEVIAQPLLAVPDVRQWDIPETASYLHITDNETIDGIALDALPETTVPIIADMSSSILSRPVDVERYDLIYAGAQKNIGPSGITVVIISDALLERSRERRAQLAPVFSYAAMADAGSMLNTPPTFAWYAAGLVFEWLQEQGGLSAMAQRNQRQAGRVYAAIDRSGLYGNTVSPANRSLMNVPFDLSDVSLLPAFLQRSAEARLSGLKGHKSRGGLRASLYNAVSDTAVDALVSFLDEFAQQHHS